MPRPTPFHERTSQLCTSFQFKDWAGYLSVCEYQGHSELEYHALRQGAGLIDVTPLYKCDVSGKDASKLLSRLMTRDVGVIARGRVAYTSMVDTHGKMLDDGTVARIGEDLFRVTSSEPWVFWFLRNARGLDVNVIDTTDSLAALSLQGPTSRAILDQVVEFDMNRMRFFRIRKTTLAGHPVWVSRTGYTGDLGFEIWTENAHALPVYDALVEAGRGHGLAPCGLDAMDISRIEAGFVLQGVDYVSARRCFNELRKSSPYEAGLGWTVELDRAPFIGQEALKREVEAGSRWALVGVEVDWDGLEKVYEPFGLPPALPGHAWRDGRPVFDADGKRQVGYATSGTWSPVLKQYITLATLPAKYAAVGTALCLEHTVEYRRFPIPATVVPKPFFDPERKRSTPGAARG